MKPNEYKLFNDNFLNIEKETSKYENIKNTKRHDQRNFSITYHS